MESRCADCRRQSRCHIYRTNMALSKREGVGIGVFECHHFKPPRKVKDDTAPGL